MISVFYCWLGGSFFVISNLVAVYYCRHVVGGRYGTIEVFEQVTAFKPTLLSLTYTSLENLLCL